VTPDDYLSRGDLKKITYTGVPEIDALLGAERWALSTSGTMVMTYSFIREGSRFDSTSEEAERAIALPVWVQDLVRSGLRHVEQVIDVRFVEVQESSSQVGILRFSGLEGSSAEMAAFAYMPSIGPWGGDVFFYEDQLVQGNRDYLKATVLHEIGHALGLKHPFEAESYNPVVMPTDKDQITLTLMSYTDVAGKEGVYLTNYPETLMPLDILALQLLYGPSRTSLGDSTYDLSLPDFQGFYALFDAGGTDTLDASRVQSPVALSLEEAAWSDVGARVRLSDGTFYSDTFILVESQIERVIGSAFDDRLKGGALNNLMDGGPGFDTVSWDAPLSRFALDFTDGRWWVQDRMGSLGLDEVVNAERLSFSDKSLTIESRAHVSFAALPDALYQFFIVAFDAAPGVTYMEQLADAYGYGMSVAEIVNVFITKPQFTDVYPLSLSSLQLAERLVQNVVQDSASVSVRQEAVRDLQDAFAFGLSRGEVIYTVFGNLAKMPLADPKWGATAQLFSNQVAVAKVYTEVMDQSTTLIDTLRAALSAVDAGDRVMNEAQAIALVIEGLVGASTTPLGQATRHSLDSPQALLALQEREWTSPQFWLDPVPFA